MSPRPFVRPRYGNRRSSGRRVWLPESFRDAMSQRFASLCGGMVMLSALVILIALFTYAPTDPSWNTAANGTGIHNWLGHLGSYGSDFMRQFFGYSAYLSVIVLTAWGWRIGQDRSLDHPG